MRLIAILSLIFAHSAFAQHQKLYYFVGANVSTKATVILRKNGTGQINGMIDFEQAEAAGPVLVKGMVYGLSPGPHGFHIHRFGDLSDGCVSAGPHFNPSVWNHGAQTDNIRHIGDLGNIAADWFGNTIISLMDDRMTLHGRNSIIGRSLVVHALRDDLGRGGNAESLVSGNAGARLSCGVIGIKDEIVEPD